MISGFSYSLQEWLINTTTLNITTVSNAMNCVQTYKPFNVLKILKRAKTTTESSILTWTNTQTFYNYLKLKDKSDLPGEYPILKCHQPRCRLSNKLPLSLTLSNLAYYTQHRVQPTRRKHETGFSLTRNRTT